MAAKLSAIFNVILNVLVVISGAMLIFSMLSIAADVTLRYFLNRPQGWVDEVSQYFLLYITFLCCAWLLKKKGHTKIEILVQGLKPKTQALVNTITYSLSFITFLMIAVYGIITTWRYFQIGQRMSSFLMPPSAAIWIVVPIGSVLICIQLLINILSYFERWKALSVEEIEAVGK